MILDKDGKPVWTPLYDGFPIVFQEKIHAKDKTVEYQGFIWTFQTAVQVNMMETTLKGILEIKWIGLWYWCQML